MDKEKAPGGLKPVGAFSFMNLRSLKNTFSEFYFLKNPFIYFFALYKKYI